MEVDFLLRRGNDLLAIEVKSSRKFSSGQTAGLDAIGELRPVVRRVLVYTGTHRLRTPGGIEVWPVETLLEALQTHRLWP